MKFLVLWHFDVTRLSPDVVRAIEYRPDTEFGVPSGPESSAPPRIPYLTDDASPPPAILPMPEGDDAANAYPVRDCAVPPTGPVWDAVARFFGDSAKSPPAARIETPPAIPGEEAERRWDDRSRPMCEPDAINPNLGKPPTGVMQLMPEIGGRYPCCPEKWAATVGRPNS